MSTREFADSGAVEAADARLAGFAHWGAVRWTALALYGVALVWWSSVYGIPVQRELVVLWTCGALACFSLGRPPTQILQIVRDWAPLLVILLAYDMTRGAADSLGIAVNVTPMIHVDEFLFAGQTPTEWLQDRFYHPNEVTPLDVSFTLIYTSYFIVPFVTAGVLWARDRLSFLRFTRRLITLALAGVTTYILFPAAPPWLAGRTGALDYVYRTSTEGWQVLGVGTAGLFSKGQASVNVVAAVPSLHAAFTALVAMFLWGRVHRAWRPLLIAYPLAMGLTLIATGEHYFFDVALGWLYAGAVMVAWGWWERRRAGDPRRERAPSAAP